VTKHILREAMQPLIPAEVLRQKKAGFGAPADHWLVHELRPMVDELLSESGIRHRGLLEPGTIRALIEEHRAGGQDSCTSGSSSRFELLMQAFLDGR